MPGRSKPDTSTASPTVSFGARLRAERERRGVTLEAIAQQTKIQASLFAAMERDDFSRWPPGIFGRSFVRAYAEVLGLDTDEVAAGFLRICPDVGQPAKPPRTRRPPDAPPVDPKREPAAIAEPAPAASPESPRAELRLTLVEEGVRGAMARPSAGRRRLFGATLDLALFAAIAFAADWLGGPSVSLPAIAIGCIGYHTLGILTVGSSLSLWLLGAGDGGAPDVEPAPSSKSKRRGRDLDALGTTSHRAPAARRAGPRRRFV